MGRKALTPDVLEEREALGLVELLYAKAARKADMVEKLRRNQTISEAVRKKALALAEIFSSSLVQQQASRLVDALFAKRLSKRQVHRSATITHSAKPCGNRP